MNLLDWLHRALTGSAPVKGKPAPSPDSLAPSGSLASSDSADDDAPAPDPDRVARMPIEDAIDLHTFAPRDVASVVGEYLREARRAGFIEVRVIHGRGKGVQRESVRRVLATHPDVESFGDAPASRGGWGATVVRLRSGPLRRPPSR